MEFACLDGPNGLEECKVIIFDELSDFQSCGKSVSVFQIQLYDHACSTIMDSAWQPCDTNDPTILFLQ
mgnify:CR=1 FL=1